jgi:hypothetical protein
MNMDSATKWMQMAMSSAKCDVGCKASLKPALLLKTSSPSASTRQGTSRTRSHQDIGITTGAQSASPLLLTTLERSTSTRKTLNTLPAYSSKTTRSMLIGKAHNTLASRLTGTTPHARSIYPCQVTLKKLLFNSAMSLQLNCNCNPTLTQFPPMAQQCNMQRQ